MKVLVWSISIPWVLMLNVTAQPAESLPVDRMMRSLKVTVSVIDTRQQVEERAEEQVLVAHFLGAPLMIRCEYATCEAFLLPAPILLPSPIAHLIEPRAGPHTA